MGALSQAQAVGGIYGHAVGSVGTTAITVKTFKKKSRAIRLYNRHKTQDLYFSIDGGATFLTVPYSY